ncbi:hypothetical protein GF380_06535 [Candidatus Uhrbacteria bacterium]|nr:hypothetical protein [Candidatus Uhrbacteria bacterium]MBD3284591.1 hypothetical protein [Candidatus Uhrbacteria bacterium]
MPNRSGHPLAEDECLLGIDAVHGPKGAHDDFVSMADELLKANPALKVCVHRMGGYSRVTIRHKVHEAQCLAQSCFALAIHPLLPGEFLRTLATVIDIKAAKSVLDPTKLTCNDVTNEAF